MLYELVQSCQKNIHFVSLKSFYQKLAITAEEKKGTTSSTSGACCEFKPFFIRSGRDRVAERVLNLVESEFVLLNYLIEFVLSITLENDCLRLFILNGVVCRGVRASD